MSKILLLTRAVDFTKSRILTSTSISPIYLMRWTKRERSTRQLYYKVTVTDERNFATKANNNFPIQGAFENCSPSPTTICSIFAINEQKLVKISLMDKKDINNVGRLPYSLDTRLLMISSFFFVIPCLKRMSVKSV